MKKSIVFFLIAVLLFSMAIADGTVLTKSTSEMELDELYNAKQAIDFEIMKRFEQIEGIIIEPGIYIVGEDIPEGNYYFTGVEGRLSSSLYVYVSSDKRTLKDTLQEIHGIGSDTPKTGKVMLENGNAVKFVQGPVVIHLYMGLIN